MVVSIKRRIENLKISIRQWEKYRAESSKKNREYGVNLADENIAKFQKMLDNLNEELGLEEIRQKKAEEEAEQKRKERIARNVQKLKGGKEEYERLKKAASRTKDPAKKAEYAQYIKVNWGLTPKVEEEKKIIKEQEKIIKRSALPDSYKKYDLLELEKRKKEKEVAFERHKALKRYAKTPGKRREEQQKVENFQGQVQDIRRLQQRSRKHVAIKAKIAEIRRKQMLAARRAAAKVPVRGKRARFEVPSRKLKMGRPEKDFPFRREPSRVAGASVGKTIGEMLGHKISPVKYKAGVSGIKSRKRERDREEYERFKVRAKVVGRGIGRGAKTVGKGISKIWKVLVFISLMAILYYFLGIIGLIVGVVGWIVLRYMKKTVSGGAGGESTWFKGYLERLGQRIADEGLGKILLKYIVWLIIIGVIVYGIFGTAVGGGVRERVISPIFDAIGKIGLPVIEAKEKIERQITGIGIWKDPHAVEREKRKGIIFTEVRGIKDGFLPDDEIEIEASGTIQALEKAATVQFGCSMENETGGVREIKVKDSSNILVNENEEINFGPLLCNLGKFGFKVEDVALFKTVTFKAIYKDYRTGANLKLYTMPQDEKEGLGNVNPFEFFKITDSLLDKSSRTTTNTYDYGPVEISLFVGDRQPLVEGKQYLLKVGVDVSRTWEGKIGEGLFKLQLPENIKFVENERSEKCDKALKLKDDMVIYCDFIIDSVEEGLGLVNIGAISIYDYEFTEETRIKISKDVIEVEEADVSDFDLS